jgi:hypothetical protein
MEFFRSTSVAEALSIDSGAPLQLRHSSQPGDVYDRPGVVKGAAEVVRKVKSHATSSNASVSDLELRPDGRVGIIGVPRDPEPDWSFGEKGIGEIAICAVAPDVANGITASTGVRLRRLPLTPERVLGTMLERTDKP